MVGSKATDDEDHQLADDGEDGVEPPSSGASCSICLDLISDNGGRSRAKLQCGHEFHLDCIGSAFNMKGVMQCPNCRKVEKGQWLYAYGSSRSLPEFSMEDWIPDEDFYDLSYAEMPFRVHWCPFGEFTRLGSSFEEAESPSTTYHTLQHHAIFTERTAGSSVPHSYFGYVGSYPPATSRSSNNVDDPHLNHHWNGVSGHNDVFHPHAFPGIHVQYHGWGRHSPPFSLSSSHNSSADSASVPATLRSSRSESDAATMTRSFPHPFGLDHGAGPRAGNSFLSSAARRYPRRSREAIQAAHAIRNRQLLGNSPGVTASARSFDGPRSMPTLVPPHHQHDQNAGFFIVPPSSSIPNIHDAEVPMLHRFHVWERERERISHVPVDPNWAFHQMGGGPFDAGNRSDSFWPRHLSSS